MKLERPDQYLPSPLQNKLDTSAACSTCFICDTCFGIQFLPAALAGRSYFFGFYSNSVELGDTQSGKTWENHGHPTLPIAGGNPQKPLNP